jgi:hypothetical protein
VIFAAATDNRSVRGRCHDDAVKGSWLLVHPPLLGPAVLGPLAGALRGHGHPVALPDLRSAVTVAAGWPERFVAGASAEGPADIVLGFSGAGVVLPSVAAVVGAKEVVWVDAVVPARSGETVPSEAIRGLIERFIGDDDRIAEWTTWWGVDTMAELIPDPALRAAVEASTPRLPADFFDVAVPVPDRWPASGARYVQLSAGYDTDAAEARARGWQVRGGSDGDHLDIANDPQRILQLLT